jgi:hypothetical protein
MGKLSLRLSTTVVVLAVTSCLGTTVPKDRHDYVGEWEGTGMYLVITPDGGLHYRRVTGSGKTKLNVPIQEFKGDDFVAGLGPFSTTFVVSRRPHRVGDEWKMTVDGVELTRQ